MLLFTELEWRFGKMAKEFKPETEKCPVCDTKWTKTNFGASTWYDCTPCGKKAEDIVLVKNNTRSGTKEYTIGNLEEWEAFIDAMNIDDDFDGIFYKSHAHKVAVCQELIQQGIIETEQEFIDFLNGV